LCQSFVLRFSDEDLDEDHSGQAACRKEEEGSRSSQIIVADEVQLGGDEIGNPPEKIALLQLHQASLKFNNCFMQSYLFNIKSVL